MVKKRTTLLDTLMRAGQRQQRSALRLVGAMLAPPKVAKVAKVSKPAAVKRAGASTDAAPGAWLAFTHVGVGARLRYWLYLPASVERDAALPLAVMLHGCEQDARSFAEGSRLNLVAEKAGFAVLYPQQSASSHPQRCWKWYDRATQHGGGDAALIAAVVEAVAARYPIDRRRIYIGGISAGAAMAHIVALNAPGRFAALGMHSGPVFGAGHSGIGALGVMQHGASMRAGQAIDEVLLRQAGEAHLPTIVIHGDDDAVVRPVNQLQLAGQALRLHGVGEGSVEKRSDKAATRRTRAYSTRDIYRGRTLLLRVVRIAGLGHAWSGGDARFKFNSAPGPDAGKMMFDFFGRHPR